jgi:flagellar biosynthesis/type III secretory pathway M-ring protein FliF/YscJ
MTDMYQYQRRAGTNMSEIIDLTSDSYDTMPNTGGDMHIIDIDFNNNRLDDDIDDDLLDDDRSTMHQLGSVTCSVRENQM